MTPRDEMQKIKNTIKYDTRRAYFGEWTPAQIHAIYHDAMDNFEHKIALNIGTLSVDAVCGVLWNEMSYNPIHFGSVSPFMFHGKNDIKQFIDTPTNDKTLNIVKELLKTFLSTAEKIDKAFTDTGKIATKSINIRSTYNGISAEYVMLSSLAKAIHAIASKNLDDFNRSKRHRIKIIEIVQKKHPNLIRPFRTDIDFDKLAQYQTQLADIESKITQTYSGIRELETRIRDKEEYEQPIDTYTEKVMLVTQNAELNELAERAQTIQYQIARIQGIPQR